VINNKNAISKLVKFISYPIKQNTKIKHGKIKLITSTSTSNDNDNDNDNEPRHPIKTKTPPHTTSQPPNSAQ
jgi:hypothetical protein